MDETTKQCTKEIRTPIPGAPGRPERFDAEYERNGTAHLLLFHAPLLNWRHVDIGRDHTGVTWAQSVAQLLEVHFPDAPMIILVMDNLSTHAGSSLYRAFEPARARALLERLEIVYTPKHGSWLNIAEIEFSVMARQCLDRRIPDPKTLAREIGAWQARRNAGGEPVRWRFTTEDARVKLAHLYPQTSA